MKTQTKQDVTINFRDFGEITIPKGTKTTHQTACGYDERYNFVEDLSWIYINYKSIDKILRHDAFYYGIDIPADFIETVPE